MWMRVVVLQRKILIPEAEDVLHLGIEAHSGQWTGLSGKLQTHLVEVVLVDMGVAKSVDEVAWLQSTHLRHHHRQQRIAGNIERHAQEDVGTSLIELARKLAIVDVKLE